MDSVNLNMEVDFEEWVTKYTEIWIGPFSLTKKEVEILVEFLMIHLQLKKRGLVSGEIESYLFDNRWEIGEVLGYKNLAFRKHLRNLSEKEVVKTKDDRLVVHPFLIPNKKIEFNFNVKDWGND